MCAPVYWFVCKRVIEMVLIMVWSHTHYRSSEVACVGVMQTVVIVIVAAVVLEVT